MPTEAARRVHDDVEAVVRAREAGPDEASPPAFPEAELAAMVDTTRTDPGRALFDDRLGLRSSGG